MLVADLRELVAVGFSQVQPLRVVLLQRANPLNRVERIEDVMTLAEHEVVVGLVAHVQDGTSEDVRPLKPSTTRDPVQSRQFTDGRDLPVVQTRQLVALCLELGLTDLLRLG
jgi:hypothetical protein